LAQRRDMQALRPRHSNPCPQQLQQQDQVWYWLNPAVHTLREREVWVDKACDWMDSLAQDPDPGVRHLLAHLSWEDPADPHSGAPLLLDQRQREALRQHQAQLLAHLEQDPDPWVAGCAQRRCRGPQDQPEWRVAITQARLPAVARWGRWCKATAPPPSLRA